MVKVARTFLPGVISKDAGFSMSKAFAARSALVLLSTLVSVSAARGDAQSRTHVTIRGTGSAVVIERGEGPVRKRLAEATAIPASPLGQAAQLKAQGASDTAIISYLRAHAAEIPSVVGSEDVKRLRKAGAGKSVVAYLTTVAAVDIGETGEGHETAVSAAPVSPLDLEAADYGMPDGYPLSGGYGAPYPARLAPRGFPHLRRMTSPPGRHVFHRSIPSRALFSRHPTTQLGRRVARGQVGD
jgi:hypothetical protein